MKGKYIIRETSISNRPPFTGMYFAGFLTGGRGATLVFGKEHAQGYDTKEAVTNLLVKVKELSGRNTWRWELRDAGHEFMEGGPGNTSTCRHCGVHYLNHGDIPDNEPPLHPKRELWSYCREHACHFQSGDECQFCKEAQRA
jgi:hypothetical protein